MKVARVIRRSVALAAGIAFAFVLVRSALRVAMGRMRLQGEDFVGEVAV